MNTIPKPRRRDLYSLLPPDAFRRQDEEADERFYATARMKPRARSL